MQFAPNDPRKFAYADPPYLGCSHFYAHPEAHIWDEKQTHLDLLAGLSRDYDGWAYSCTARDLSWLAPILSQEGVRVASWVKPFAAFKRNVPIAWTWEPVIFKRALPRRENDPLGRDHLAEGITLKRGFTGAKPHRFNRWVLDLIGYQDELDTLTDLFPGTGGMQKAMNEMVLL